MWRERLGGTGPSSRKCSRWPPSRKIKPAADDPAAGSSISDESYVLENAEHDRANEGEGDIGRHNAQPVDERTQGHRKPPAGKDPALTFKANDPFQREKVSVAVHPFHLGGAQRLLTWLKSRENKALMSP
jgi:hypothetical protein